MRLVLANRAILALSLCSLLSVQITSKLKLIFKLFLGNPLSAKRLVLPKTTDTVMFKVLEVPFCSSANVDMFNGCFYASACFGCACAGACACARPHLTASATVVILTIILTCSCFGEACALCNVLVGFVQLCFSPCADAACSCECSWFLHICTLCAHCAL